MKHPGPIQVAARPQAWVCGRSLHGIVGLLPGPSMSIAYVKVKVSRDRPRWPIGVPGRLRPRIFSTFGTTRVVGRQPNAPAAFTPGEIPGTHFQRLSRPQDTWFCRKEPRKKMPLRQKYFFCFRNNCLNFGIFLCFTQFSISL